MLLCSSCKEEKPSFAFSYDPTAKNRGGRTYYCRFCAAKKAKQWYKERDKTQEKLTRKAYRYKLREEFIAALGGKCEDCNLYYPPECYDFHHLDPTIKDFSIAKNYTPKARKELKKCVLLCANCHRKRHADSFAGR